MRRDLAHDHEWDPETVNVEHDECVYVTYGCTWAEVTSAVTSERHDETFYGYGAECAASKHVTWRIALYHVTEDGEERVPLDEVAAPVWLMATDKHRDALYEAATSVDPYDIPRYAGGITMGESDEWYVELQRESVDVKEDWA